jgi:type IV pilus assembly protein PilB
MATNAKKSILQILGEQRKITMDQAKEAVSRRQSSGEAIEDILLEMDVDEVSIYKAKAELDGVSFLDLQDGVEVDPEASALLADDLQERYGAVPILDDGEKLTIAMTNPKDVFAVDEIRIKTGRDIIPVLIPPSQHESLREGTWGIHTNGTNYTDDEEEDDDDPIAAMLADLDPNKAPKEVKGRGFNPFASKETTIEAAVIPGEAEEAESEIDRDFQDADEAPIIRIVNTILMYAIRDGASDIHVEPQRKGVRIRYRIDGVLHEQMKVPQYVLNPLISRIKIMADMNIAERRVPQDGRIHIKMQEKEYDMRVNTCPTAFGEKVVMRILDKSSVMIGLDKLGLYPETQTQLLDICHQPNGCFMICGPTGSGKTTTLYSVLNVVNSVEKNVMTVEDPVEYQLAGLSQVHVNRKAGLTFANALRAFLRQDPDVIMVGEIRDLETAEIAVQAALTGHLVLSTIHTNDAPSTATRLGDMGVEPFLISASLVGALAQRLSRRVCSQCKTPYQPQRELLMRFGFDPLLHPEAQFYKGLGCERCRQTGYKGRLGCYELMRINEELAELIVRRSPLSELKEAARANGMATLQEDGFRKCKDGMTNVEEVMRVVFTGGH